MPEAVTRVAELTKLALTQGPEPAVGGGSVHPAMLKGDATVTTGCPLTMMRVSGEDGLACPACRQVTVAPRCRIGALTVRGPGSN